VTDTRPASDDGPAPPPGRLARLLAPRGEGGGLVEATPVVPIRRLLRRFWPYARPYKRQIAVGLLLVALVPAVQTVEIWLFKVAVDEVVVAADVSPLAWLIPAVIGLTLLGAALAFGEDYAWTWAGERFLLDLRASFFDHLQRLSLDALDRRRVGDLVSRFSGDVQAIESFVLGGLADVVSAAARILFFSAALALLDWRLALVTLVVIPPFAIAARKFSGYAKRATREKRRRSGSLSAVAEESLSNAALVQSCNRQLSEQRRFRKEGKGMLEAELAAVRVSGAFGPVIALIEVTGVLTIVALGTLSIQQGRLSIGGLIAFLAFLSQLLRPISDLSQLATQLFAATAGGERVIELLDEHPTVVDRPGASPVDRALGAIELDGVTYRYPGAKRPALSDATLRVEPGEVVAVIGPSGAGKSTIARLLLRFADPESGSVRLDGRDLRDLTLTSLRENVGLLQQETLLFDASVTENVAFGREGATTAQVEAAARAAGAHEFVAALPRGYATRVGPRGRALSGGQRRRIEIARALLRDTPVVVLDEPTTGLDASAARALIEPLRDLLRGRTAILVTHDPELLAAADRTLVVEDGTVADAAHAELVA
jgi:ABC-type multidrug transport system fused ATPase/permease subunit